MNHADGSTVIDSIADTDSIQRQLQDIHVSLKAVLPGIGRVAVAIYDEQTDLLKTFVHSTDGATPFSHYEKKLALVPSLQELAESSEARIIGNLQGDGPYSSWHVTRLIETGYRSSYTTPFYDHGRFFGFLFFDSRAPDYFGTAANQHLTLYSHLISLLIINEISRVSALRSAIDVARKITHTRSEETGSHLDRMARYARLITKTLADQSPNDDIDDEFVEFVFLYAPLHDVGKIAIPDRILLKPGRLTEQEFNIMKGHVDAGMVIVETIADGFNVGSGLHVEILRNIVRYHHESFDGTGYLSGRRGLDIPLEARIVTVADVFDALTTHRCYKSAWTNDRAFMLLNNLAGTRFDPQCVAALTAHRDDIVAIQAQFDSSNIFHEAYTEDL